MHLAAARAKCAAGSPAPRCAPGRDMYNRGPMLRRPRAAPATPALPWWATPRGAAVIVALAALAAFARALANGFTYDEGLVLVGAQRFLQSGSFGTLLSQELLRGQPGGDLAAVLHAHLHARRDGLVPPGHVQARRACVWHVVAAWLLMALRAAAAPGRAAALGHRGRPAVRAASRSPPRRSTTPRFARTRW